jgi:hypothetical protein
VSTLIASLADMHSYVEQKRAGLKARPVAFITCVLDRTS